MDTVFAWNSRDMLVVIQYSDHLSDHITTDGRNEANLATLNVHPLENLSSVFELLVTPINADGRTREYNCRYSISDPSVSYF